MDTVTNAGGTLITGLRTGFNSFMDFLPALLGAVIVLAIGWVISGIVARLLEGILHRVKLERAVHHAGIHQYYPSPQFTISHSIAFLAKWFVRLIFIQAAANILRMPQISLIINTIILYIPNVVAATLILVVGAFLARWVSNMVTGSMLSSGVARPGLFAAISRYAILGFAVIAALNQLGIATSLVNAMFMGLVFSLSLAFGLAFGLGGQGVASEITRGWYNQGRGRLQQVPPPSGLTKEGSSNVPPASGRVG